MHSYTKRLLLSAALLLAVAPGTSTFASTLAKSYAQGLVDRISYLHPGVLRIDLISTPPGSSRMTVVASTVAANTGHPSTAAQVATSAQPQCRVTAAGAAYECVLQLRDTPGNAIGSMVISLPYFRGQDMEGLQRTAIELRDQLAETTPALPTLFEDRTIAPKSGDLQAQCMVLSALAHHPDLMVLAFHVTAPGETVNKMLAINVPRFMGNTSEPVEHDLAKNGNILLESISQTHRIEIHVPLLAANGDMLGTMATVYFWHRPEESAEYLTKTFAVQQELKPQIRDLAALYEPCEPALNSR